jgi:predicted RNA-binding protein YlqC (UPF0109 family)
MRELLHYVVTAIVHHPDDVVITEVVSEDGSHLTLRLSVNQEDMGLIIGRDGNIARSLRNIVKVLAIKHNQRVFIDILESTPASSTEAVPAE